MNDFAVPSQVMMDECTHKCREAQESDVVLPASIRDAKVGLIEYDLTLCSSTPHTLLPARYRRVFQAKSNRASLQRSRNETLEPRFPLPEHLSPIRVPLAPKSSRSLTDHVPSTPSLTNSHESNNPPTHPLAQPLTD
jgi:hypothetical protein